MRKRYPAILLWASTVACLCLPSALWAEPSWEKSCVYPLLHEWDQHGKFISCDIDTESLVGNATYEGGYTMELRLGEPPVVSLGIEGYPRVYSHNGTLLYTLVPESVTIEGRSVLRYTLIDPNGLTYTYRGVQDGQDLFLEVGCPDGKLARYEFPFKEGSGEEIEEGFACLDRSFAEALSHALQGPAVAVQPSPVVPGNVSTQAPSEPAQIPAQGQPSRPTQTQGAPPSTVPMSQTPPAGLSVGQGEGWFPLEPPSPGWDEWVLLMSRLQLRP